MHAFDLSSELCGALFGEVAQGCVYGPAGSTGRASRLREEPGFRKGGSEDVEVYPRHSETGFLTRKAQRICSFCLTGAEYSVSGASTLGTGWASQTRRAAGLLPVRDGPGPRGDRPWRGGLAALPTPGDSRADGLSLHVRRAGAA